MPLPIKAWKILRTVLMNFEVERFVWLSYTQWSCLSTWCLESQILTADWLVIRMEIWHLPAWRSISDQVCGLIRVFGELLFHGSSLWTQTHQARTQNTNLRFFGIQIDDLMGCVGQHLTCAMVALAQSLAGNSLSSVNLLRCIPKGRYKWKPFLELLSQVVYENVTTFASSGSTWNSMVSFCCVLSMYRSDYLSWFVIYTYIVHSHISWTNRTSMMYNRWVMSHESWVKSWGLWHVSADFPGRTSTLMMTSVMTEVVGWRSFLFWAGKDPQ